MDRLEEIEAEKQRAADLMEQVLAASEQITTNIGTLLDKMDVLENTTGQTISAATQEVTAHSNETLSISNENTKVTGEVGEIIGKLHEMAQKLSGMTGD